MIPPLRSGKFNFPQFNYIICAPARPLGVASANEARVHRAQRKTKRMNALRRRSGGRIVVTSLETVLVFSIRIFRVFK